MKSNEFKVLLQNQLSTKDIMRESFNGQRKRLGKQMKLLNKQRRFNRNLRIQAQTETHQIDHLFLEPNLRRCLWVRAQKSVKGRFRLWKHLPDRSQSIRGFTLGSSLVRIGRLISRNQIWQSQEITTTK